MSVDIDALLNRVNDNFSLQDRMKKLAEECSEYVTAHFHYESRGDKHLRYVLEEIAGIDFVLLTLKTKIYHTSGYREIYSQIFRDQMSKAVVSIDNDILRRGERVL